MNALTEEWVKKAEDDFRLTLREDRVKRQPNYDAICFHAQQCVEKYLKAFLQEHGQAFPKNHDLVNLLELALPLDRDFDNQRPDMELLVRYAVIYRYPGEEASEEQARAAVKAMKAVRAFIREKLGLK